MASTSARSEPTGGAARAHRVLALIFLAGAVVQFFLAGLGVFGIDSGERLDDQSSLDPHRALGSLLIVIALVQLLLVLVARPTRVVFVPYVVLFVLTILQSVFAAIGGEFFGGLHGVNAIAVFGLAGYLGHRAFRREVTAR